MILTVPEILILLTGTQTKPVRDMSYTAIGRKLGTSQQNVSALFYSGRRKLRKSHEAKSLWQQTQKWRYQGTVGTNWEHAGFAYEKGLLCRKSR